MQKIYLVTLLWIVCACGDSSSPYDTRAVGSLDKLAENIGGLNSCSYTLDVVIASEGDSAQVINQHDVYLRGPDKMHILTRGTKGRKGYWYNGSELAYFSFDQNVYDTISAPETIMATVDHVNKTYGIDFPATDLFYPTLTDDVLEHYDSLYYRKDVIADMPQLIGIEAVNDRERVYVLIDTVTYFPNRFVIKKLGVDGEVYDASFSNWRINPELPDILFEFEPPTSATRKIIQPKKAM